MYVCMLSKRGIADLAVTAIEGGINYWCNLVYPVERDGHGEWINITKDRMEQFDSPAYDDPNFWKADQRGYLMVPVNDEDRDLVKRPLTANSLRGAFKHQPKQVNGQSNNWFGKLCKTLHNPGQYDAGDADTIVQIAVMDEVVYA